MTKLEKALENMEEVKRIIMEKSCPSEFGMEGHCSEYPDCEGCWRNDYRQKRQ